MPKLLQMLSSFVLLMGALSCAEATDLTISMDPPLTYVDGSPILASDTITCNLYGGSTVSNLVLKASGPCTKFVRPNVTPGNACYSATAVSALFGTESAQVTPICVVVPQPVVAPKSQPTSPPQNFKVTPSG